MVKDFSGFFLRAVLYASYAARHTSHRHLFRLYPLIPCGFPVLAILVPFTFMVPLPVAVITTVVIPCRASAPCRITGVGAVAFVH